MSERSDATGGGQPVIRFAEAADGPRCNDFYNRQYKRSRSIEQWRWEFEHRVPGSSIIPFVLAEHEGEIVGTQALIPIELMDSRGPYWSAKSEETLVAESMRGRGLLHRLYEPLHEFAREQGIASIWGFTPARSAFEREGFTIPTQTGQLIRAFGSDALATLLSSAPHAKRRRGIESLASAALALYGSVASATAARRPIRGLDLRVLESAPEWADQLSSDFVAMWGGTTIHRSRAYMDWRFFQNPFRRPSVLAAFVDGRPVGWTAFGLGSQGTAAVVDIVVADRADRERTRPIVTALLSEATERARNMGATAIRAWDVTAHPFAQLVAQSARRLGWLPVRRGFDMVLKFTPGLPTRDDAQPIDRWYITRTFTEGSDV